MKKSTKGSFPLPDMQTKIPDLTGVILNAAGEFSMPYSTITLRQGRAGKLYVLCQKDDGPGFRCVDVTNIWAESVLTGVADARREDAGNH